MSKICFFEQTNVGFGVTINDDYLLSRLQELELVIIAKNTEVVWRWNSSDNSLQNTPEQPHYFRAYLEPDDTLGKIGDYWLQIRVLDTILGERKFDIIDIDIHKAVAIGQVSQGSNVVNHIFSISITNEIEVIEGIYNINVLWTIPKVIVNVVNETNGFEITHNLNCIAVRCTFYDATGQQDFNFLFAKKDNNKIVCVFPTDDPYTGKVLIEKIY